MRRGAASVERPRPTLPSLLSPLPSLLRSRARMHYERSETYRVPPERLTPLPQGGATVTGSARSASLPMEWEEHPWEWIWPKRYALRRVFTRGPFHEMRVLYEITPEGQGCRVKVSADLEPAGIIGRLIAT